MKMHQTEYGYVLKPQNIYLVIDEHNSKNATVYWPYRNVPEHIMPTNSKYYKSNHGELREMVMFLLSKLSSVGYKNLNEIYRWSLKIDPFFYLN